MATLITTSLNPASGAQNTQELRYAGQKMAGQSVEWQQPSLARQLTEIEKPGDLLHPRRAPIS